MQLWGSFQAARRFIGALATVGRLNAKRPVETGRRMNPAPQ